MPARAECAAKRFQPRRTNGLEPDLLEGLVLQLLRLAKQFQTKTLEGVRLQATGKQDGWFFKMELSECLQERSAPRSLSNPAGPMAWSRTCSKVLVCNCCGWRSNFRPRPWRGSGSKPLASRTVGFLRWSSQSACKSGVRREAFPTLQDQWLGAGPARRSWSAIAAAGEAISDQDLGGSPAPSHWQAGQVVLYDGAPRVPARAECAAKPFQPRRTNGLEPDLLEGLGLQLLRLAKQFQTKILEGVRLQAIGKQDGWFFNCANRSQGS